MRKFISLSELQEYFRSDAYRKACHEVVTRKQAGEDLSFDEICDILGVDEEAGQFLAIAHAVEAGEVQKAGYQ